MTIGQGKFLPLVLINAGKYFSKFSKASLAKQQWQIVKDFLKQMKDFPQA